MTEQTRANKILESLGQSIPESSAWKEDEDDGGIIAKGRKVSLYYHEDRGYILATNSSTDEEQMYFIDDVDDTAELTKLGKKIGSDFNVTPPSADDLKTCIENT